MVTCFILMGPRIQGPLGTFLYCYLLCCEFKHEDTGLQQRCGAISSSTHSLLKGFIQATPAPKQLLHLDPELDSVVVVMCFSLSRGAPRHTHTIHSSFSPSPSGSLSRIEVVSSTVSSPFTHPALGPELTRALKLAWYVAQCVSKHMASNLVYVCWGEVLNCTLGLSGDANEGWVQ